MGWIEGWDRRNQRWARRVTATPPADADVPRWLVLMELAPLAWVAAPVIGVGALVAAVIRRRGGPGADRRC